MVGIEMKIVSIDFTVAVEAVAAGNPVVRTTLMDVYAVRVSTCVRIVGLGATIVFVVVELNTRTLVLVFVAGDMIG